MDKLLKPDRFNADPGVAMAAKQWLHWFRTFENFVNATQASGTDKLNLLINYIAPSVYEFISESATYESAVETLRLLYVKPKNEIFARHLLATRRQEAGETLDSYLQALKQLSKDCGFKAVSAEQCRDEAIRDAFIGGLTSGYIRQRLLENITLNLEAAFDQARGLEMAQSQADSYTRHPASIQVATTDVEDLGETSNETTAAAVGTDTSKCFFCGNRRHPRSRCPARNGSCNGCGKKGHFAKVCKSVQASSITTLATVSASAPGCLSRAVLGVLVNGEGAQALIDTGSSESFINSSLLGKLKIKLTPTTGQVSMASTSLQSPLVGCCYVTLTIGSHIYPGIKLLVLKSLCADLILGHDILKLHSSINIKFGGSRVPLVLGGLTTIAVPSPSLFANLTQECRPIAVKSRRQTVEDTKFIDLEVARLLREGIIEKSESPWRAQVLVIASELHKKRMVIDYSQTINRFTLLDAYPLPRIEDIVSRVARYQWFSSLDLQSAYHQVALKEVERPYTAFEAGGNLYQFCRIPFGLTNGVASFQRVMDGLIRGAGLVDTFAYVDNVIVCGNSREEHDRNLQNFMEVAKKYRLTLNTDKCEYALKEVKLLGYVITGQKIRPDPERLRPFLELGPPSDMKALKRVIGLFAYYARWISKFSEKIYPLVHCRSFPMSPNIKEAFEKLKLEIADSFVMAIDETIPLVVETDASDHGIAATLSQAGRPVAFFTRTLSKGEQRHSAVEKEACAIVEALRKWRHYLIGHHFKLITDQKSVAFMFDNRRAGKIKNEKIMRWRMELACFKYEINYRPGGDNVVTDTFSRICSSITSLDYLRDLHNSLCHPGITRMAHFVRCKNLPFSVEDVRRLTGACAVCSEVKPRFYRGSTGQLIKATAPFEHLSLDFKGPLPSVTSNRYMLTIVDEYSRFPFAFPCKDMSTPTVIKCLSQLFSIFGMPAYIHSDRGAAFMSRELKAFLYAHGVATSRTTAYNPRGNGQVERYNGIIWKTLELGLRAQDWRVTEWERALPDALHSIRSLLCTATNATPHERMFVHQRRSASGIAIPSWLALPGPVYMKRPIVGSKYDPAVEEVQLLEANPQYAHVRLPDGRETTVSVHQLAPWAGGKLPDPEGYSENSVTSKNAPPAEILQVGPEQEGGESSGEVLEPQERSEEPTCTRLPGNPSNLSSHRPLRDRQPPAYLQDYELS